MKTPRIVPKQIWKRKGEVSKGNIQNNSTFYVKNVSKGQIWVVKKKETSDEKKKLDSTEKVEIKKQNVFVKNEKDFPNWNESYCVKIPKVKQA
ncbi:hypothetical protein Hanom_Chr10g00924831 [Helianthus anomalus]